MATLGPPTEVTARRAAEVLGITEVELAQTLSTLVQDRLVRVASRIERYEIGTLDEFDEEIAGARRAFESLLTAWAVVDASEETKED